MTLKESEGLIRGYFRYPAPDMVRLEPNLSCERFSTHKAGRRGGASTARAGYWQGSVSGVCRSGSMLEDQGVCRERFAGRGRSGALRPPDERQNKAPSVRGPFLRLLGITENALSV